MAEQPGELLNARVRPGLVAALGGALVLGFLGEVALGIYQGTPVGLKDLFSNVLAVAVGWFFGKRDAEKANGQAAPPAA